MWLPKMMSKTPSWLALQAGLGRSEAAVLAATVSEIKKQTALKAALKRKVMSENPDITSEWFETFYAQNIPTAPVVNNNNNNNNAGNAFNGNNSPQTTSHHSSSSSSDSEGSSSSKGKGKRVKKEN
jgi:hypothetical protein